MARLLTARRGVKDARRCSSLTARSQPDLGAISARSRARVAQQLRIDQLFLRRAPSKSRGGGGGGVAVVAAVICIVGRGKEGGGETRRWRRSEVACVLRQHGTTRVSMCATTCNLGCAHVCAGGAHTSSSSPSPSSSSMKRRDASLRPPASALTPAPALVPIAASNDDPAAPVVWLSAALALAMAGMKASRRARTAGRGEEDVTTWSVGVRAGMKRRRAYAATAQAVSCGARACRPSKKIIFMERSKCMTALQVPTYLQVLQVHPYRVGVAVVGRTVFRLPIYLSKCFAPFVFFLSYAHIRLCRERDF